MEDENNMLFDCAMIIGAGAVENAWTPIISLFQSMYKELGIKNYESLNSEDINYILAGYIYRLEFVYLHGSEADQQEMFQEYKNIKEVIAETLKQANKKREIWARNSYIETMNKFIPRNHRCGMISTNWDMCVEKTFRDAFRQNNDLCEILYLHGNYENSQTLYLPSEKIDEPYRTEEDKNNLRDRHAHFSGLVKQARRIILYGISLSILDVELVQILYSASIRTAVREIFVIDTNPDPVAKRLSFLFSNYSKIEIVGFRPDDLDCEINY